MLWLVRRRLSWSIFGSGLVSSFRSSTSGFLAGDHVGWFFVLFYYYRSFVVPRLVLVPIAAAVRDPIAASIPIESTSFLPPVDWLLVG